MLLFFPAIHGTSYGWHRAGTDTCRAIRFGFHQALEVTILMVNCPFDIGDQEHLFQDIAQALTPGHQLTIFAIIQRYEVARAETTYQGDHRIIGYRATRNPFDCVQHAQQWPAETIWGPNKVSGLLHGNQRFISTKSAVVLFGRLLDAVEFGKR
ncbi:hypothetical protein T12_2554 [Trichinella patagoniensis]|uniref:Uncharacterized protein n=1 Tax=Trichinella patagoniensis TaxID=990121 RepID=A0A0V0Z5Y1_9BILA|nr:hypothetical protein T12_2554 [Trichinella patagoniensis]